MIVTVAPAGSEIDPPYGMRVAVTARLSGMGSRECIGSKLQDG